MDEMKHYTIAITGASGSFYGIRLIEAMLAAGCHINLILSESGNSVLKFETGIDFHGDSKTAESKVLKYFKVRRGRLNLLDNADLFAPTSSGSYRMDGMIICPCSMGTLGRIASGHSQRLIERTADVMMKEKRRLIIVPRETPLNQIHLENMLRLSRMGVDIVPAMPAFYQRPECLDDIYNFIAGKVLNLLDIKHDLFEGWGAE